MRKVTSHNQQRSWSIGFDPESETLPVSPRGLFHVTLPNGFRSDVMDLLYFYILYCSIAIFMNKVEKI